ncbi:AAA family ATPase [Leptolyngbya sp. FACHB-671]|uniref:AAA family ATPase n=1 Tax=Leptolyngbya sp. FACHB-671 TaxID=2692812 RepID=UPI00168827E3|nr:AAA family ATPase [Leptolyngbya sp. FACHB-671]MBD2070731.1 AAA family ATPase [Leptolyngbya sp. FACHB-671]
MTNEPKRTRSRHKPTASIHNVPPAYFLSLEIEHVLCFKDRQILDVSDGNGNPAQWTVILGDNGVGKTTLLRCLAGMELELEIVTFDEHDEEWVFPILYEGSKSISLWQELEILEESAAEFNVRVGYDNFLSLRGVERVKSSHKLSHSRFLEAEIEFVLPGYCSGEMSSVLAGFVCYGYGATRRMGEASLGENFDVENSVSLFSEKASLINAEEWLLQTDYAARSASGKTRDRLQKNLNQIIEILKRILPDVEDIRIAPADEETPRPRAEFLTPYGWVRLSSLGLGYRTAIAWMVDLAVRLFRRYPDSQNPLAEPAIVLVDEIDLHLHPKWQRNIMSFLTERFPNTQFIVTAHSPLVVQAAADANIVLLRREGDRVVIDNNPEIVDNWRVDQVLTSVFELPTARPVDLEPMLARRQELLEKARLSKADEAELQELEAKIGSLPTAETPDDIKAMDIIRRAAQLLENS